MVLDLVFEFKPKGPKETGPIRIKVKPSKTKTGVIGLQEVISPDVMLWCLKFGNQPINPWSSQAPMLLTSVASSTCDFETVETDDPWYYWHNVYEQLAKPYKTIFF